MPSTREKQSKQVREEILEAFLKLTAKERLVAGKFKSHDSAQVMEFCPHGTKLKCLKAQQASAEMGGDSIDYVLNKLAKHGAVCFKRVTIGEESGCEVISLESKLLLKIYKNFINENFNLTKEIK